MYNTPVIFLTGAGASIPLGIPGMAGLAKEYAEEVEGSRNETTLKDLYRYGVSPDLEDILQFLNLAIDLPAHPLRQLVEDTISPQSSKASPTKKLTDFRGDFRERIKAFEALRSNLLQWLRERCLKYDRPAASRTYSKLASRLAHLSFPIFTTNYDSVYDFVARAGGIDISDNFLRNSHDRYFWDHDLHGFHESNALRLVHIHGSVLWHQFPDGKIERIQTISPKSQEGIPLHEILIFPTRFKEIYDQPFFPLYSGFTRSLDRAHVLYVIGHSLRDEYLLSAIREQLWENLLLLIVIDPVLPGGQALEDPGMSENVIHIPKGIESIYPLLNQSLDIEFSGNPEDTAVQEIREFWTEVRRSISKGKKDQIGVADWQVYAEPGELIQTRLILDTMFGGETFKASLNPHKDTLRRPLKFEFPGTEQPRFSGRRDQSLGLNVYVPEDLPRGSSHKLRLELLDIDNKPVLKKDYTLKIRKHPKD